MKRIFIFDPETNSCCRLSEQVGRRGYIVQHSSLVDIASTILTSEYFDMMLIRIRSRNCESMRLIRHIRGYGINLPFIFTSDFESNIMSAEAFHLGAFDYCDYDDADSDKLLDMLKHYFEQAVHKQTIYNRTSPAYNNCLSRIDYLAAAVAPVLLIGESGCGKSFYADRLHFSGPRRKHLPIHVECSTLDNHTVVQDFLGAVLHSGGSRHKRIIGYFTKSKDSILFLDRICLLPMKVQQVLANVIESGMFRPIGSDAPVKFSGRIVASSDIDLRVAVEEGRFNRALFDLLTKIVITVPPLRDCPEDILGIARQMIDEICHEQGINSVRLTVPVERRLCAYHWPGNLRELHSTLYRAIHRCSGTIRLEHLIFASAFSDGGKEHDDREKLISALIRTGGNIQHTADLLDISRPTVYRRIEKYEINTKNLAQYVQS